MANIIFKTAAGRFGALVGGLVIAAAVWVSLGGALRAAPPVPDPLTCLPTCEIDGRHLVVAGDDNTTLSAQEITVGLSFTQAAGATGNFALFDGDREDANWDVVFNCGVGCPNTGALAPKLIVELFADPAQIGGAGSPLATWTPGQPALNTEMGDFPVTNNAWNGVTFNHDAQALNGTDYFYAVHIRPQQPEIDLGWNSFKIRANGTTVLLGNQVVGFIGAMNNPGDLQTIYPNYPSLTPTVYDGTWVFKTRLPAFLGDVTVFDGDMDFGNSNCAYNDTDDPDSAGIPPFALGSAAVAEGVAVASQGIPPVPLACSSPGSGTRTGTPADDNNSAGFRRVPSIVPNGIAYQLKAPGSAQNPNGQIFLNQNPSGNREWEQFKIQLVQPGDVTNGACPVDGYPADPQKGYPASDCRTTDLPGGLWEIQLDGMDLSNLNFWFFSFKVEVLPTEYSIGRLVWYDANENGLQDLCAGVPCAPELGIANVAYTVYDGPLPGGQVVRTGFTDSNGEFLEDQLPAGNYTVVVDSGNFATGQPLNGLTSTTGGETEDGIEVGLPVCIDTNNPVGCGQPSYAEAIFGYVEHSTNCIVFPENGGPPFEGAVHQIIPNPPGSPAGALTIRTTLALQFVDNTYGTNAIGWPSGHTFSQLVGSDHVQLSLFDTGGVKRLQFKLDYITASQGAPGGYAALGVSGGEGSMILGAASNITHWDTSLSNNFANGMQLTVNSPPTDSNYTTPPPPNQNWIFPVWYDVTFRTDLFPGGPQGFGAVKVSGVHASPSKTGSNTEVCLYEGDPGTAVADLYNTTKNVPLTVPAPGVLSNDTDPFNLPLTAVIVTTTPANRGTLNLNANGGFTFTPCNNCTGDAKFTYKTYNGTSYSNVVESKIKISK